MKDFCKVLSILFLVFSMFIACILLSDSIKRECHSQYILGTESGFKRAKEFDSDMYTKAYRKGKFDQYRDLLENGKLTDWKIADGKLISLRKDVDTGNRQLLGVHSH
jgi:hypothetical protein